GIRDDLVTGVQTCALPISGRSLPRNVRIFDFDHVVHFDNKRRYVHFPAVDLHVTVGDHLARGWTSGGKTKIADHAVQTGLQNLRSEERRVGKEWRVR